MTATRPPRSSSRLPAPPRRARPAASTEPLPLLKDRIAPGVRVLFVGINPGVRSAQVGHHFAGYSNKFWKLLVESGLVPEPITYLDDDRLPLWGFGMTNLIARPTPGIDELTPEEYRKGRAVLERKVRRYEPRFVVFIGVTLARAVFATTGAAARGTRAARRHAATPPAVGLHAERFAGVPVFVLPNPSGRNAHYSYAMMLEAFRELKALLNPR